MPFRFRYRCAISKTNAQRIDEKSSQPKWDTVPATASAIQKPKQINAEIAQTMAKDRRVYIGPTCL